MRYDTIVIGAGHAGCEAALACARMGCVTLLVTMSKEKIAHISCNPSIGGVGKGQLVKEVDALGGEMGKAADTTGIHFRMLNKSRGPAVWSSRAQIDSDAYSKYMRSKVLSQENLEVLEDEALELIVKDNKVSGLITKTKDLIQTKSIIIATGTFLNGLIHVGLDHESGGRYGEPASIKLSESLKALGFEISSLKTGTTPRLKKESINFTKLIPQPGDDEPLPFSFSTKTKLENKVYCHIAYTNPKTHAIIQSNLDRSPLYTGIIKSTGVRYCPSIEDKIMRFPDRDRHQVFLEPEGLATDSYYANGISTSLPLDIQKDIVHSIEGLEEAQILREGYGIEYEFAQPTQLYPTLETKRIGGLYFAGQINGTTGYEEAAAQGLVSGINAALNIKKKEPLILERSNSYIGVLIDDLTTKGTNEPYRMFTSRVEYRLIVREDNADIRLRRSGYDAGLVSENELRAADEKKISIENAIDTLNTIKIKPGIYINTMLESLSTSPIGRVATAAELLRRPQVSYNSLKESGIIDISLPSNYERIVELLVKYDGFIKRQIQDIRKMEDVEKIKIPKDIDFSKISGLTTEIIEKLSKIRPVSLGQASRISGITPAAIALLMVYFKKYRSKNPSQASC
ncbi:tRNA uridine-5-carboxymethylaminomethyl(34) synthesis enzyme MnmG [Candidatus Omnitrophota bacterium]